MNRKQRRAADNQAHAHIPNPAISRGRKVQEIGAAGIKFHQSGDFTKAEKLYTQALALDPHNAQLIYLRGTIFLQTGRMEAGIREITASLDLNPNNPDALNNLSNALRKAGRVKEAIARYTEALRLRPNYPDALNNLGNALRADGRLDEAIGRYNEALWLNPHFPQALNNLGNALSEKGRLSEAIAKFSEALRLEPAFPEALTSLGNALEAIGKPEEAVAKFREALHLRPDFPGALNSMGRTLRILGRLDEAKQYISTAIELSPNNMGYHYNITESIKYTFSEKHLSILESLENKANDMDNEGRMFLHFALGKAHDDIGLKESSFRHFLMANALKREMVFYDESKALSQIEDIKAAFSQKLIDEKSVVNAPRRGPILIVGMPRSGSTLIEQILASHQRVSGAGEVGLFAKATIDLLGPNGYPKRAVQLSREALLNLGSAYLVGLQALCPQAQRIVDKNLSNFLFCGLVHLALPQARIIHMARDPIDTCLSCFSKFFSNGQVHTYDLGELGRFYRAYEGLMEHWRKVLPPGIMLDVQYEEVVADLEGQARRILSYCGLEWDEACLSFYKTERPVRTASVAQVREPIYTTSVGRWRPDSGLLKPLTDALGPLAKS